MSTVLKIINEEIKTLFENLEVYTIPELAELMGSRMAHPEQSIPIYEKMLRDAYKEGGDDAVVEMYGKLTGVEIEALRNGRYVFANLTGGGEAMLQEVGEANIRPYEWWNTNEKYMEKTQRGQYNFKTDNNLEYYVFFNRPDLRKPQWRVDFQANDTETSTMYTDKSTNRGEPLKIMATIADIVKDFVVKMNPQVMEINAAKEKGGDDNRRLNLYQRFVEKNLPEEYRVEKVGDKLVVSKSNRAEYFEGINEIQDNANHCPDEMPS